MGPLTGDAGQALIAVVTHRSHWRDAAIEKLAELSCGRPGPSGRIVVVNGDETGFLGMRESSRRTPCCDHATQANRAK